MDENNTARDIIIKQKHHELRMLSTVVTVGNDPHEYQHHAGGLGVAIRILSNGFCPEDLGREMFTWITAVSNSTPDLFTGVNLAGLAEAVALHPDWINKQDGDRFLSMYVVEIAAK